MRLYDFLSLSMNADVPVIVRLCNLPGKRPKVIFHGDLWEAQVKIRLRDRQVFGWETMPNDPEGKLIVYVERELSDD